MAALFFAGLGLAILLFGAYQKRQVHALAQWRQTTGRISRATVKQEQTPNSEGSYTKVAYQPMVRYEYVVSGATYVGWRIGLNAVSYMNPARAEAQIAAYPPGAAVVVYYDPEKPADCVLIKGAPGSNFLLFLGAAMLGLVILTLTLGRL